MGRRRRGKERLMQVRYPMAYVYGIIEPFLLYAIEMNNQNRNFYISWDIHFLIFFLVVLFSCFLFLFFKSKKEAQDPRCPISLSCTPTEPRMSPVCPALHHFHPQPCPGCSVEFTPISTELPMSSTTGPYTTLLSSLDGNTMLQEHLPAASSHMVLTWVRYPLALHLPNHSLTLLLKHQVMPDHQEALGSP